MAPAWHRGGLLLPAPIQLGTGHPRLLGSGAGRRNAERAGLIGDVRRIVGSNWQPPACRTPVHGSEGVARRRIVCVRCGRVAADCEARTGAKRSPGIPVGGPFASVIVQGGLT